MARFYATLWPMTPAWFARHKSRRTIDPQCLENLRPEGAESTLTGNAAFPFPAAPRQPLYAVNTLNSPYRLPALIYKEAVPELDPWILVRFGSGISAVDQLLDDPHPPHPHSALQSAQLPVGKLTITACL